MASAYDQFFNMRNNVEATLNTPVFYDLKKYYSRGESVQPGEVGTVGVLILPSISTVMAVQNLTTGEISTQFVGNLTFTPRGTDDAHRDQQGSSVILNIWGHTQPFFFPGDFSNIVCSSDQIRFVVIYRQLREYDPAPTA